MIFSKIYYIFSNCHSLELDLMYETLPLTLSFSASGTCLVSLGFGIGDPVFILNSGGTFVSSTTWIGTDNAGCNHGNTIVSFTHGISNI